MANETVNVNDAIELESSDVITKDMVMVTGGIGDMLALIRKLLSMNLISDALKLMDMWQNDNKYTLHDFKTAIREALVKLGVLSDGQPVAPRLNMDDDVDVRVAKIKRPSREEVVRHLRAKGVKVQFIPPTMLAILIQLAIQFGLPLIEAIIDRIVKKQSAHERLTWADLMAD